MNTSHDAINGDITDVLHNPGENRFEMKLGEQNGELAVLEYLIKPFVKKADSDTRGTLSITHTYVPGSARGHGVAGRLTQAALEYAEQHELTVVPLCSYAVSYLARQNRRAAKGTSDV